MNDGRPKRSPNPSPNPNGNDPKQKPLWFGVCPVIVVGIGAAMALFMGFLFYSN